MERQYSHLTWKNRLKIRRMLDERRKPKEIADALHVHTSTIYREIKRGQTWQMTSEWEYVQKYCPETAERKYRENLQAKGPDLKIGNDHALASYLEEKIGKEHYSPAAALAKIKEEGRIFSVEISEWTLYSYIDKGVFATITNKSLPTGKKKKHPYRKVQEARLPKGDGIEDRSEEINSRKTFGHWEMDTVVSARRSKKRLLRSDRATDPLGDHRADEGRNQRQRGGRAEPDGAEAGLRRVSGDVPVYHHRQRCGVRGLRRHGILLPEKRRPHPCLLLPPVLCLRARQQRGSQPDYPALPAERNGSSRA